MVIFYFEFFGVLRELLVAASKHILYFNDFVMQLNRSP